MKNWFRLLGLTCMVLTACGRDPAKDVKILTRQQPPDSLPTPTLPPGWEWHDEFCTLPSQEGSSDLTVTGPCSYHQVGNVRCTADQDDFLVMVKREAPRQATLTLFINVEKYTGPGDYKENQMFIALNNGKTGYRWSSDNVTVTVGPGAKYVEFPKNFLPGEPPTPGVETISGKLWCD